MDNGSELHPRVARLEEQLAVALERERKLSDFIENAALGLHSVGADGTILWANQSELDLLGFTRDEYIGRHIADFHADADTIDDILRRLKNRETLNSYEARLRGKDGSIHDVLISSNVLWDGDRFVHTRCYTRDVTERKHADKELQTTHRILQTLVDSSPLPVVVFTPEGNVTLWNPAAERVFGWKAAEVLGAPIPFIPEDKREEHRAMRALDLSGHGFTDREVRRRTKDDRPVDVRVSTAPLHDESGALIGIMSVYVDITDRKLHERRLLAQYAMVRILAETSSLEDTAPRVLAAICENLDWAAGLLWTVQPGEGGLRCTALWQQPPANPMKGGAHDSFEASCRLQKFEYGVGLPGRIWASAKPAWIPDIRLDPNFPPLVSASERGLRAAFGFPIFLAGTVSGVMEFFTDDVRAPQEELLQSASTLGNQIGEILEFQRARKNLAESEENYRALTEAASDGIISIDQTGRIQFANTALVKIFGYSREELIGSELTMLMPDQFRAAYREGIQRYIDTGKRHIPGQAVQLSGRHKDGHEIPLEISLAESRKNGKHVFIGVIRDITERKRYDEGVRQTAKLESLGLLAGGIAHDFNNLLTGIIGNVSVAREMLSESHPGKRALQDAEEAGDRAAHLTKQLLDYAGKGRFVIELIDLSNIAREIAPLIKPAIANTVQLRLDLAEKLPCVEGDATQIQQLIMNLAINGAEAIGKDTEGTVLVSTAVQDVDADYLAQTFQENEILPGKYVRLEVHDTGSGMDEDTLAHIFDPFFTTKFTGRGLGLAAAVGIVRGHKGSMKVYSEPGKGSTFKVLFPAHDGSAPEKKKAPPRNDFMGKGTVLVVDDEEVVRKVAKTMLELYGYDVLVAENGLEAVEIFQQLPNEIVLIVLDLTMPVMDGEEALRQIKILNPNVPVLLTSGFNEMEAIQRFAGKGLAGFVQKPYSSARLAEKLKAVLAGS